MEAFSNTIGKMSEIILRETFNGQPQTGEFMTDDLRIVSYLTQPIYGANDEIVSALAITQDVTEERKAQAAAFEVESLRVAMSKEQELNDLKTRMMIRISHEFRTPLSVISTSSEMIQRYFERMDANRRAEHFAQIQDQIMRIAAMLDDITLIMRVQTSGRITRSLDLSTAVRIQDACDEVLRTEPGSEDIQFECVEGVPSIEGDHEMILRMVRALVSNAIKYSPVGSPVHLGLTADAEVVHITVSDSGSGIPEADLPRIFEPFYRGSNIDEVQGIGLGLSIVEAVVNLHNGNVEVDTVQGEGTTISVRLPYR
jgi:signal transduction histidine kinase